MGNVFNIYTYKKKRGIPKGTPRLWVYEAN